MNLDITVEDGFSGDEVEAIVDRIEQSIRETVPEATRIFVEVGAEA